MTFGQTSFGAVQIFCFVFAWIYKHFMWVYPCNDVKSRRFEVFIIRSQLTPIYHDGLAHFDLV